MTDDYNHASHHADTYFEEAERINANDASTHHAITAAALLAIAAELRAARIQREDEAT